MLGPGAGLTDWEAIEGISAEQSRLFLETMVASSPVGLAFVDLELRFIHINDALAAINGLPREAHLGRKVRDVVPELWPGLEPHYRQVMETGRPALNLEVAAPSLKDGGTEHYFLVNYYPVRDAEGVMHGIGITVLDTTESKRADRALRLSEQRYRSLVESVSQTVWTTNGRGEVVESAPHWLAFTGQAHAAHLGLGWLDALHPSDRTRFVLEWATALETRDPYQGEVRLRFRDGTYRDTIIRSVPVFDERGLVREWISTAEDITERKRAEGRLQRATQALRASDERYRTFVARSTEGIWRLEVEPPIDIQMPEVAQAEALLERGLLAEANEQMAGLTGFASTRDMLGATLMQMISRLTRPQSPTDAAVRPFIRQGYRLENVELRQVDGGVERVCLANFFGVVERGRLLRVWGTLRDVTEQVQARRKAEELAAHLSNQQQWLESVFDLIPIAFLLLEPDTGRVLFANQAAHRMAGGLFPMGVPWREYDSVYRLTDEQGRPLSMHEIPGGRAARGERLRQAPVVWHTPTGTYSLLTDSELLPAMHGHPATVVLALQDVTRLKQTEAQLQESVRLRDEFLTVASHELKTPLTPLQIKLQGLAREAHAGLTGDPLRERVRTTAESASWQLRKLATLINDLLDVTQLTSETLSLQREWMDLSAVLHHVAELFRTQGAQAGCDIVVETPGPVVGFWDRHRLEQVARGLLSNAIKYGPGRPVVLRVELHGERARFVVRDEGIGIAPENLSRIFEKFGRAVSTRNYGGLGLGLFISRRIVEAHRGTILAESRQGEGATFTVELPLAPEDVRPGTSATGAARARGYR